ncbi:hypothetical protein AB6864_25335 [Serratia proteamaculans]|uniref:hypothetical protein n=1 Tax=Serratia proteamaculans TaxID=28151 RepID=UPI0039BDF8D1
MSEIISSVINGVKDRTSGVYGYLATSFCLFNWSNIYFLFFSKRSAEEKLVSLSLSFEWFWHAVAPFFVGILLCLLTPYISSGIKDLQKRATWWSKRLDFKNDNFSDDLQRERNLKISENKHIASQLETKVENLNSRLASGTEKLNAAISKHSELTSQESSLLSRIADKTDELQKLEIKITQENNENLNFEKIKTSYDKLKDSHYDQELKNDKSLGILSALIDGGYVTEHMENLIHNELNEVGIHINTKNPLRRYPRPHELYEEPIMFIGGGVVKEHNPAVVKIPKNPRLKDSYVTMDGAYFDDENKTMRLPSTFSASVLPGYIQLIYRNGFGDTQVTTEKDGTTTIKFDKQLDPKDKKNLIDYYEEFNRS